MGKRQFFYLVRLQFLGFRYSGWQKQPGQKTIEQMLAKTLKFVLPDNDFKILGAGRTDAKVSALDAAFELFAAKPLENTSQFIELFNKNLPSDIRIVSIDTVDQKFNIIQNSKIKEYVYLFSFGEKNHPFCAPFMANILEDLHLDLMMEATKLFVGTHDFAAYTSRKQTHTITTRKIDLCEIRPNTILEANFLPEKSYALHVKGKGFMRYQIRMIMGALIQLGKGELTIDDLRNSLKKDTNVQISYVAPGSGLLLRELVFD